MNLWPPEPAPNACRHHGQPDHVESYFLRCNHPTRPLALWVKATILAPLEGDAVAETWMVWFDGERGVTHAQRHTDPLAMASFPGGERPFALARPSTPRTAQPVTPLRPRPNPSIARDVGGTAQPDADSTTVHSPRLRFGWSADGRVEGTAQPDADSTAAHSPRLQLDRSAANRVEESGQTDAGATTVRTPHLRLSLGATGRVEGSVQTDAGALAASLTFRAWPGAVGQPLTLFPWRLLREGPFPRSKLLTPQPALEFTGTVHLPGGETVEIDAWPGMQGHNWGREHAFDYAWGQCVFPATASAPAAMVEGFSARVKVAGRATPRMSSLVVRRGDDEYRFDTLFDPWRQDASLTRYRWSVRLRGAAGEVRLRMDAAGKPEACLGYRNPDGHTSYCFNSKLADTLLEVWPARGAPFTLRSPHGGALEFLRTERDLALPVV